MENDNTGGNTSEGANTPDPIAQLKGEFHRKNENINNQLAELKQITAVIAERLSAPAKAAPSASADEDVDSLLFTDPKRAAQMIKDQAKAEMRSENAVQAQAQARVNSVLNELTTEYPELNDTSAPLTKRAAEIYNALPENERGSAVAFKLAAKEAAAELGVKPRSKRNDEDFMGNGSGSGEAPSRRRRESTKLDPVTEQWAALLGVDLEDSEVKERLIKRSQRNFSKWEQPLSAKKKGNK